MKERRLVLLGKKENRNFGIDLLRGFSILFVIIHHLAISFRLPLKDSLLGDVLGARFIKGISFHGYEAVFVFFVISGFLITKRTLDRYGRLSDIQWKNFYVYRFIRIVPLLLFLLTILSLFHLLGFSDYVIAKEGQTLGGALFSALGLHLNLYEARTGWLPAAWDVLWSLSIEEVFYLAFPLLCIFLPHRLLIAILLFLAFSLPWVRASLVENEIWQEKAYLPGMSAIAFGVLSALLVSKWKPSSLCLKMFTVFGMLGLIGSFFYDDLLWPILHHHIMLLICLSACSLLIAAFNFDLKPIYGLGWLAKMGFLSYELYLSHMFIVLTICAFYRAIADKDMTWSFLAYVPSLIFCYGLSVLLEKRISRPSSKWLMAIFANNTNYGNKLRSRREEKNVRSLRRSK